MFYEIAGIARDWAILLLVAEGLILLAVPLFILLKITQGLRKLKPKAIAGLQVAREKSLLALGMVDRSMVMVAKPFIWTSSQASAARAVLPALRRILRER